MQIRTPIVVGVRTILTRLAPEQLAIFPLHAFARDLREPLAFGRFARLPLFLHRTFPMAITVLIEALIGPDYLVRSSLGERVCHSESVRRRSK
jgi:hypothetical protein